MPTIIVNENICKGCELCIDACPRGLIILAKDKINSKGYHPAVSYTHLTLPTTERV